MRNSVAGLVVVSVFAGCMTEGRKIAQESIARLADRQMGSAAKVAEYSRTNPVQPELARLVTSMDEDAYGIKRWTTLTQADFGRAAGEVDLSDEGQARAQAMYEREIAKRNALRAVAARAGLPIESPNGETEVGDVAEMGLKYVLGPAGASIFGLLWRGAKKKQRKAEELADRRRRAAREAIQVIGSSKDTEIRKTAAMKRHLLEEYGEMKREEYDERAREIENGVSSPPQQAPIATVQMEDGSST
jgi:hypothetical protein